MRVLILGEGKSGTTAALRMVSQAMDGAAEVFEPRTLSEVPVGDEPIVVKKLLSSWRPGDVDHLDSFDRRILLLRDPRDRLISHLLYDSYNRASRLSEQQERRWIGVIRQKVRHPVKRPFVWVMEEWWKAAKVDLHRSYARALDRSARLVAEEGKHFHIAHYEDLVQGNVKATSEYLGLDLDFAQEMDGPEARVSRSRSLGEWRHWFNPVDVSVFRPSTTKWLGQHGYNRDDWDLANPQEIDPATSLDYVEGLLKQGRAQAATK